MVWHGTFIHPLPIHPRKPIPPSSSTHPPKFPDAWPGWTPPFKKVHPPLPYYVIVPRFGHSHGGGLFLGSRNLESSPGPGMQLSTISTGKDPSNTSVPGL